MKKILYSLVMIAAVSAVAIGATRAYFTDQEVLSDNVLAAGKVDIDLRGDGPMEILLGTDQYFQGGLVPGEYSPDLFEMIVYNQGWGVSTIPVKYRFRTEFVDQSVPGYWELLRVRVRHNFAGSPDPANWPIVYQGSLNNLSVNSIDNAIADYLDPNISHVYYFEFGLSSSAGNVYQGASADFRIVVDATQYNNPGWDE